MEKNDKGQVDRARRQFLIAARGTSALGAVALLFGKSAAAQAAASLPPAAQENPLRRGYHETEHIREYYRSARYW